MTTWIPMWCSAPRRRWLSRRTRTTRTRRSRICRRSTSISRWHGRRRRISRVVWVRVRRRSWRRCTKAKRPATIPMANMRPGRLLVEYIYLDGPGIESLYAQICGFVETSRTTTIQKGVTAKVGAGLRLKNFLISLLSGLEGEVSAEVAGSRNRTEQSTMAHATENKLSHVLDFLTKTDEVPFFNELGAAT